MVREFTYADEQWVMEMAFFHQAPLLAVVGLRYLWYYFALTPSPAWLYAIVAFMGHVAMLAYIPIALVLVPVTILIPRPPVILSVGVFLASAVLSFLALDSLVFAENRYHLGILTITLLAPPSWAFFALYFLLGTAIEAMLAVWVWKRTALSAPRRIEWYLPLVLGGCLLASHLIHWWAEAHYYVPVTAFTRYLPLYFPYRDAGNLWKLGLLDRNQAREQGLVAALARPPDGVLNYPRAPLRCESHPPTLNVLLVVIDAMRADALTPEVAPRLNELTRGAIRFDRHYSGGNSSRAGMFSLFYGLPATYWDAFADFARPPVLMDMFRQNRYQLGLFSSSPVYRGAVGLDRTALARIPNLRLETSWALARSGSTCLRQVRRKRAHHVINRGRSATPSTAIQRAVAVAKSVPSTHVPSHPPNTATSAPSPSIPSRPPRTHAAGRSFAAFARAPTSRPNTTQKRESSSIVVPRFLISSAPGLFT